MGHVLARISGFGWTITPHSPYRFTRIDGSDRALTVERSGSTPRRATLAFESREPRISLSPGVADVTEVCDLATSAVVGDFRIETNVFTSLWPAGFDLVSPEEGASNAFDLVGGAECIVYPQGPFVAATLRSVETMRTPDQRILAQGTHATGAWIELAYEHDGVEHWQRHTTVRYSNDRTIVITAQSPIAHAAKTRDAAILTAESIAPYRADAPTESAPSLGFFARLRKALHKPL